MATDTPRSPASRLLQVEHFGLDQDQFCGRPDSGSDQQSPEGDAELRSGWRSKCRSALARDCGGPPTWSVADTLHSRASALLQWICVIQMLRLIWVRRSRLAGEGSGSEMSMATDTPRSPASRLLQVEHFGLDQDQFCRHRLFRARPRSVLKTPRIQASIWSILKAMRS